MPLGSDVQTGKTESIASMIPAQLGTDIVDIHEIADATVEYLFPTNFPHANRSSDVW